MRIVIEVPDLAPTCTRSHAVASYLRALVTYQALRRELATAAVHVAHCKKVVASRVPAHALMAEAQALCEKLGIEADVSATTASPN
jgi:hypothetical protein